MAQGFVRLYRRFWADERVRQLSSDEKLVAAYLLAGQSNRIGLFRFSVGMAEEDLGIPRKRLDTLLHRVCDTLSWGYDAPVGVVFIRSWWRWNPPESEKTLTGYLKDLADLPKTALLKDFRDNADTLPHTLRHTLSDRVSMPEPMPEPEPEPEPEPVERARKTRAPRPQLTPEQIAEKFSIPLAKVSANAAKISALGKYRNEYRTLLNWCAEDAANGNGKLPRSAKDEERDAIENLPVFGSPEWNRIQAEVARRDAELLAADLKQRGVS